jgi:hypothetical protein
MMTTETQVEVAGESLPVVSDDVNPESNIPEGTAPEGVVDKEKQDEPAKTFTQAEVDALIQKRLLKEERRVHRRIEQQQREQQQTQALTQPTRESYRDEEAFLQANLEHFAEKRAAEKLAERDRVQETERRQEAFMEKAEKASERYTDFQVVVSNPALSINDSMAEFISESDHGADVAYFLGKNPLKAAQIAALSPIKAARELARIESDIASRPQVTASKAPDPITPVGSRGKASTSSSPNDDDDIDTWMRKEAARQRKR